MKIKMLARLVVGHAVPLHQHFKAYLGVIDDPRLLLVGLFVVHEHNTDDGIIKAVGEEDVLVRINVLDVFSFHEETLVDFLGSRNREHGQSVALAVFRPFYFYIEFSKVN